MRVLLGVTGGIAAYKSAETVRLFDERGDDVRAAMTESAREFLQPMTLQVLTDHPVGAGLFDPQWESEIGHIDLARWADAVLIAPATANAIARLANGMGDDLLSTVVLATEAPVVLAPSMNTKMWHHELVQENVRKLEGTAGFRVVDPDSGELACKEIGAGRMPDPPVLVEEVLTAAGPRPMAGRRVLVTAGPTREHVDPARMLTNPSTGRMGYAMARTARRLGADVVLVSGPTEVEPPPGVEVVDVVSAEEMRAAVLDRAPEADIVCKAAAVSDWRPVERSEQKLEKTAMSASLALERNPDILAELGERWGPSAEREGPTLIGFAAETGDVVARAREKLDDKNVHAIVANEIGGPHSSFGSDSTTVQLVTDD
ncbi:MAG: bifunctional phosphopantothenoylcysteine decarboxylase/phosphopantothenate--cysteine ligase CoaBC, partial [Bradymonadaceae bacterium]